MDGNPADPECWKRQRDAGPACSVVRECERLRAIVAEQDAEIAELRMTIARLQDRPVEEYRRE